MPISNFIIREAKESEYPTLGEIMVNVYSKLEGFPSPEEQPVYYNYLKNIGNLSQQPATKLFVAVKNEKVIGGVIYFSDMKYYGAGGKATLQKKACGFRLLAVDSSARGQGVGKMLSQYCIETAQKENQKTMFIHSTMAMKIAWKMYDKMGFKRYTELDFEQEGLEVFGFVLKL